MKSGTGLLLSIKTEDIATEVEEDDICMNSIGESREGLLLSDKLEDLMVKVREFESSDDNVLATLLLISDEHEYIG